MQWVLKEEVEGKVVVCVFAAPGWYSQCDGTHTVCAAHGGTWVPV